MINKSEECLMAHSLTSTMYYPNSVRIHNLGLSRLNIGLLPSIDPKAETAEMIFGDFDYVAISDKHKNREPVKVKMGKLYIEYELGGKGSYDLSLKLINTQTRSISTLLKLKIGRFPNNLLFETIMPFSIDSLECATIISGIRIDKLSQEQLNKLLSCIKIQEHITNLCLDLDIDPNLFNRDLTNFVNLHGESIDSYQLLPILNRNSIFFSSMNESESSNDDLFKFQLELLLDQLKTKVYASPYVCGYDVAMCEQTWPTYKPGLDMLTEATDNFFNNQINLDDFTKKCQEILESFKELDSKIRQESTEIYGQSRELVRYMNKFIIALPAIPANEKNSIK